MIQVGKSVRFRHLEGQPPPHRKNDVGRVIGIRMLNTDDTRDLLCTVEWCDHISDAFDWDLEVVENIDNPNQTS